MRAEDALGRAGEQAAARFLTTRGMRILDRNWRCADGEIDIVARHGNTLVVCEVKTRSSRRYGRPLEAVGPAKAARLRRLAAAWLAQQKSSFGQVRIDAIGLTVDRRGGFEVRHVRGVA